MSPERTKPNIGGSPLNDRLPKDWRDAKGNSSSVSEHHSVKYPWNTYENYKHSLR